MDLSDWHPSRLGRTRTEVAPAPDDVAAPPPSLMVGQRADCCLATPIYRIALPSTDTRDRVAELLMCGHHYHACEPKLLATGAAVFDSAGRLVASGAAAGPGA